MADSGDQFLLNRAETAEAKLGTLKANIDALKERVQQFKANFGIRERSDGSIVVDFDKFVKRLGPEASLELRSIIDDKYAIRPSRSRRHLNPQIHINAS